MHSKFNDGLLCIVAAVTSAGCDIADLNPESETLQALVGEQLTLPEEPDANYIAEPVVEWFLVEAPEGSSATIRTTDQLIGSVEIDKRGRFVIDRWIRIGVSERWTHRYFVEALNAPPVASIAGSSLGNVGVAHFMTGLDSHDSETPSAELEYAWKLAFRPQGSIAELDDVRASETALKPDIVGHYKVELDVFDGELWSKGKASITFEVVQ